MPTYVYQRVDGEQGCSACRKGFETQQPMSDDPVDACPRCGARVQRVIGAANVAVRWRAKTLLSDANLKRHGFNKLHNEGDGKFRVT